MKALLANLHQVCVCSAVTPFLRSGGFQRVNLKGKWFIINPTMGSVPEESNWYFWELCSRETTRVLRVR